MIMILLKIIEGIFYPVGHLKMVGEWSGQKVMVTTLGMMTFLKIKEGVFDILIHLKISWEISVNPLNKEKAQTHLLNLQI